MNSQSERTDRALGAFFMRFAADRERGEVRPLSEYLQLCPSNEDEVAREYLTLTDDGLDAVPEAAQARVAPRSFGPYRIESELGRGGQATVYLAIDTRIGRQVALKVLHAPLCGISAAGMARFRREAELLARLDHPGICVVHDVELDGAYPYLAMRYLRGQGLADWFGREGGVPLDSLLETFERVARALHTAHETGLVHRDIKPGNIMVSAAGDPVILDFGLACDVGEPDMPMTLSGEVLGTPSYLAPEVLRGDTRIDRRCDVYALGLTLYECAVGRRAFGAPQRDTLFHQILTETPESLCRVDPGLPKDLDIVVRTAIEKDPDRRYSTALEFAEELRRIRGHEPVRARSAGVWLRSLRFLQRNPVPVAITALVFVLLGCALFVTQSSLATAERERDAKEQSLSELQDLLGFADSRVQKQLRREARSLRFVADVADVADVAEVPAWLDRARALQARLPKHRRALDQLRQNAQRLDSPGSGGNPVWEFQLTSDDWRHATLVSLIGEIEAFHSEIERVAGLWASATDAARRSVEDDAELWRVTREQIMNVPGYAGLELAPQVGFVPLGADRVSGLHEFALSISGAVPTRDPVTRELQIRGETAIVFVLMPGGEAVIGASSARDQEYFDVQMRDDEGPVHRVLLDPFFLGKYEVTQGQYLRLVGRNPSNFKPGRTIGGKPTTLAHPVEWVTWKLARECLSRFGLELPTEVQWECALRGGTKTAFITGHDVRTLDGSLNGFDLAGERGGMRDDIGPIAWLDDGYVHHAPVGSYRPSPFGLHDMLGNVGEWCRDVYHPYTVSARPGDGLRGDQNGKEHVLRGGSFYHVGLSFRSARRSSNELFYGLNLGFRAARAVR